jgi:hypothetical protein
MKQAFCAISAAIYMMWLVNPVVASDLKASSLPDGRVVITIIGELEEGDAEHFGATMKLMKSQNKPVSSIALNSIGGSLVEAVEIAEVIQFEKLATIVRQGAKCASACFLIFAAGQPKLAGYNSQIGVHGASDEKREESALTSTATLSMARVANKLGVPAAIIGRMVITRPNEMLWLSPAELQSMGTTMVSGDQPPLEKPAPKAKASVVKPKK